MSYIDHGSRIFGTTKSTNGLSMSYGDYVLPRKRSEGRLKTHDSCSDIRAWSLNPNENSRYFREIAENAPKNGKVVPFNVLIDNIIKMGSQTQEELESVKKELENYKSLKLTSKQKEELEKLAVSLNCESRETFEKEKSLSKIIVDNFLNNSCNDNSSFVESNKDISIQVQPEVSELAVQYDSITTESDKISTEFTSSTSQSTIRDEKSFCSVNSEFENETGSDTSRSASDSEINRRIIIEKESKIIALENEVEAKNAELEEREETVKSMRNSVKSLKNVLDQKSQEIEDLRTKMRVFKIEKRKLLDSLDNQSSVSEAQLKEIDKLRFRTNQEENIRVDLIRQVEQMRRDREVFRRKVDLLQRELKEKNDLLLENEREYQELFLSWQKTSDEQEKSKTKTMQVLKVLEIEIEEKNNTISEYEAQIINFEHEVGDMFVMLKTGLSEIEFVDKQKIENRINEEENIILQTKATVSNVNLVIKLLETERIDLQKQLDEVKNEKRNESNCAVCDAGTNVNYESSTDLEETRKESQAEIKNLNLDENSNIQNHLESQESIIEMWNYSLDKKIDSALETHLKNSILKIRQLTEAFKDIEIKKLMKMEELRCEINKRNVEIENLKNQNSQWKGEGDCYQREIADREKRERKLEEKVCSYEFKLHGVNQDNSKLKIEVQHLQEEKSLLLEKHEEACKEIEIKNQALASIENYKQKVEEMQSRLSVLQTENEKSTKDLLQADKIIEKQKIDFQDLLDEKHEMEEILNKFETEIQTKNSHIKNLSDNNCFLAEKLEKNEAEIKALNKENKFKNNQNLKELSFLQKEVTMLSDEKYRLTDKNCALKSDFTNYQNKNLQLECELETINKENEKLSNCINILKDQFEKVVSADIENKISMEKDYSNKMMKNIAALRENYENQILQEKERKREIKLKYTGSESESIVSKDCELNQNSSENSLERKEKIVLINKSTNFDSELCLLNDCLNEKMKNDLENESRQKDNEIEKLKHEIDAKNSEIRIIDEKHKRTLITVAKKKDEEIKNLKIRHDQKIQKLEDNFNSWNSDGFSFGTENWLKSLSIEELKNLCKRISSLLPFEELVKIINNKQNKYHQEDLSEKQKLIEKVTELENHILKINQSTTIQVEELDLKLQQERCKSAGLQKLLAQNERLNEINNKSGQENYKLFTYDDGVNKEAKFWQYISEQNYIKTNRFLCNQSGKRKHLLERKAFSGDECSDNRRRDFIHLCSANMRHK